MLTLTYLAKHSFEGSVSCIQHAIRLRMVSSSLDLFDQYKFTRHDVSILVSVP